MTIEISDVDLSNTIFEEDSSDVDIIDSNGQKYIAGTDTHGWFSITMVELFEEDDGLVAYPVGDYPTHSFDGSGADKLRQLL